MSRAPDGLTQLVRERATQSYAAAKEVFRHPGLRNLELSLLVNWAAEFGYVVALSVFAYDVGGALAVGLLGLGRYLPAGAVALIGSAAADRYRRESVLRAVYIVRAVTAAASAVAYFTGAPSAAVFVLGALVTIVSAALRPAFWALVPVLARTPEQLTASNVLASTSEGVALLIGPAAGGIVLAATNAGVVFAGGAALFAVSAAFAFAVSSGVRPKTERRHVVEETVAGIRAVAQHPDTRVLVMLGGAQTFVRGALIVLIVIGSLRLLDMGEAGVGFLNSAFGVGNLVGAIAALTLVGRRRLGIPLVWGLALWGAPIALVAAWPHPLAALVLLAMPGWGNAVFDIAILTLLQRITPDEVLGRVFGLLETVVFASMAAGSIAASGLVALFGVRGAFVATGCLLPIVIVVSWHAIRRIDERSEVAELELALLKSNSLFAGLPAVALEHLAAKLEPVDVAADATIFREGDRGDLFFVVGAGSVTVTAQQRHLATLTVGDHFGEIALLRGVPRTATVTARERSRLFALRPEDFLAAVSRYEQCARVAEDEIGARLRAHDEP